MNKFIWLFVIVVLVSFRGNPVATSFAAEKSHQVLVFTTPENEGAFTEYQRNIYKEISKRTGVNCVLKEMPKKSGLIAADSGFYDGVAARVKGLETEYTNLKMINVSHFTVQHVLFTQNPVILKSVHNLNDLTEYVLHKKAIVGYLHGSVKAKKLLSKIPTEKIFPVNTPQKGFELLQKGRIAVYLAGPGIVNRALLKTQFHDSGIKEVCVLSETRLFPYLNQKHSALVPKFEKVLQVMVNDGTMRRIRQLIE